MICAKLLPQGITRCIDANEATINRVLEEFHDVLDETLDVIVVVNGIAINTLNTRVKESDEIVIVQEFMGG